MSPPLTDAQLNEQFEEIPILAGRPRQLQELSGGPTKRNVKITTPDGMYVARCTDIATTCWASTATASITTPRQPSTSVGAQVIDYRPDVGILLLGYSRGRPCATRTSSAGDPGQGCRRDPHAALGPAVPRALRYVREAAELPEDCDGQWIPDSGRLPRPRRHIRRDRPCADGDPSTARPPATSPASTSAGSRPSTATTAGCMTVLQRFSGSTTKSLGPTGR
jgi:hypothetical protein